MGVSAGPLAYWSSSTASSTRALSAVDDHQRLGLDRAAERHELVDAEIVVLDALPGRVLSRRSAVGVSDAVPPVVAADEISARPAIDRRVELLAAAPACRPACRGRCRPA